MGAAGGTGATTTARTVRARRLVALVEASKFFFNVWFVLWRSKVHSGRS